MILPLVILALLVQAPAPQQGGSVTGILRLADGKPAAGVRVGAMPRPESLDEVANGAALSSIAETDEQGRYRLEDVPPGLYYISAGRLDLPTYYPGTQAMGGGTTVTVAAGETIEGIDFTLAGTSEGRAETSNFLAGLTIPLEVRVENGGRLPVSSGGKPVAIEVMPAGSASPVSARIDSSNINLPTQTLDYDITVEGLPPGYTVASLKYGSTALVDGKLSLAVGSTGRAIWTQANTALGAAVFAWNRASPPLPQVLSIVLGNAAPFAVSGGVRVSGRIPDRAAPFVFLSGNPGTVFSDGTFEFHGVGPGRHTLVALANRPSEPSFAASVVVGDREVEHVLFEETLALPRGIRTASGPSPAVAHPPGQLPLATVRGVVLDSSSGQPVTQGSVFLVGDAWSEVRLGPDGRFEFPRLLPGEYDVEVQGVGHPTFRRPLVVGEDDIALELRTD